MMSESVGAKLRQARELRRLTLQQVAEATRVRPHYLQALENDDHSAIPSAAQARGFLRIYADYLEINLADIMPVVPPSEPMPVPGLAAAAEKVLPVPETLQPDNILTRLRARFARRTDHDEALAQPAEAVAALPTQETEPKPKLADLPSSDANNSKTVKKKRNVSG
jgi:transcriptional regulator with XRE-family HTH domain